MSRTSSSRFQVSCFNSSSSRVRIRSKPVQSKSVKSTSSNFIKKDELMMMIDNNTNKDQSGEQRKSKFAVGRRIMVVVDLSYEVASAIQWTLTHTVQSQDTLVLLHVVKPNSSKQCKGSEITPMSARAYELLHTIKNLCHLERPEVQVEVEVVKASKQKGPTIVQEAKKQGVSLLILGQRKRTITWRLLQLWRRRRSSSGVVEYCIENANCMAIGVRRKSKKLGGYLITTQHHKDFWILA
ncbi:hypothetical protein C5167_031777 [Papaver somniferum]|uniref:UspA domain-containing protein n=1 Tax=Papaver somniferum TaxID=3469 RepID=A0A4Y7K813_PAPSO|nr:uncharacterized protein LOC113293022 [Papaver somniferum]RZC68500.1 hypothetical protein C5167_031777 [Papaver somniferum]